MSVFARFLTFMCATLVAPIAKNFATTFPLAHITSVYMQRFAPTLLFKAIGFAIISSMSAVMFRMVSSSEPGSDNFYMLLGYVMFKIMCVPIEQYLVNNAYSTSTKRITDAFSEDMFKRYNSADHISRQQLSSPEFYQRMKPSTDAIDTVINWGLGNLIEIIGSVISCFIVTYDNPLVGCSIVGITVLALCATNDLRNKLLAATRASKDITSANRSYFTLLLGQLQDGFVSPTRVNELETENTRLRLDQRMNWESYDCKRSTLGHLVLGLIFVVDNPITLLLVLQPLVTQMNHFNRFLTRYRELEISYESLQETFAKMRFTPQAPQIPVESVSDITITSAMITGDKNKVLLDIRTPIQFKMGSRYLLTGPSGGGKSTFINGLVGNIPGMKFSMLGPENYRTHFAVLVQKMKEVLRLNKISIRKVFDNTNQDARVAQLFNLVELGPRFAEWGLDNDIDESRISGGEKTRLSLALLLYRAADRPYFVLDEPDQGLDWQTSLRMIKGIIQMYPEKAIIMSLHSGNLNEHLEWSGVVRIEMGKIV